MSLNVAVTESHVDISLSSIGLVVLLNFEKFKSKLTMEM